jgi:hypothetical protein
MFKKLSLALLISLLLVSQVFAASATVTRMEWGFEVTGGTDATYIAQDTWVTATAYKVSDRVVSTGVIYICKVAHTSGTFATDLTAGDWAVFSFATMSVIGITQKANSATDTSVLTSGFNGASTATNISAFAILNTSSINWGGNAITFINPKITLASASDIVYIYTKNTNF